MNAYDLIIVSLTAGIVGTMGLTLYFAWVSGSGITRINLVSAIGAFINRSDRNAGATGLVLHFVSGIVFAGFYYFILHNVFHVSAVAPSALAGGMIGIFHGMVSAFPVLSITENHPVEGYRGISARAMGSHLIGHCIFGLIVGIVIGLFRMPGVVTAG